MKPRPANGSKMNGAPQAPAHNNGNAFALRVLGIDPAAAGATGYAVIDARGPACAAVHYGAIPAARKAAADVPARLKQIHLCIAELIEQFSPDSLALESIFSALNVKTALRLAEVRGVILLAAAERGLPVHSYSPREVKAAVTGYGQAEKSQIQQMVRALLSLKELPQPADAADALAVALCHIQTARNEARFGVAARLLAAPRPVRNNSLRGNLARLPRVLSVR
ncbi:MAG TPA: crossover junction endodeoxyribonuclease RuvC [Candidatus Acidoferrum sp.]|nr:crossover junction endodeoxyribonuclease RuvC [Candidatus Acidoferrum sp.]